MKPLLIIALAGGLLATMASPPVALAQGSSAKETLLSLLSGNQNQNKSARDEYERRYNQDQRDEARLQASSYRNSKSYANQGRSDGSPIWDPNVDHGGGAE